MDQTATQPTVPCMPPLADRFLMAIHPLFQFCAIIMACYAFFLGMQRARKLHFGRNVRFDWQRHVLLGRCALLVLSFGALGGAIMVYRHWHRVLIAGLHAETALIIVTLALFGLVSGWQLNRRRRPRLLLTILHGLNNCALVLLALTQIISGLAIYRAYLLGY